MSGINMVMVSGNLGADPELRLVQGGLAVLRARIATNEVWYDKDEKKQERVEWHRVTVFGKRAEGLAKFLRKGMFVSLTGTLRTSSYEKDGQKKYSTEIIANDLVVAPRGPRDGKSTLDAPFPSLDDAPPPSARDFASGSSSTSGNGFGRSAPATPAATDIPF